MKLLFSQFLIAVLFAFSLTAPLHLGGEQIASKLEPSKKSWDFAKKYVGKMSLNEKIGQLIHIGINAKFANQDSAFYKDIQRQVVENKIGGIIFFVGPVYETVHLTNRMQAAAKTPLMISLDAETGVGMRFLDAEAFPWAMAVAATGEPELARRMGVITGREARATGFQHVFAPVFDINNNASNPVINVRSFGEDPETVAKFGVAFAEGLQSERVLATAKHFPGHGDTGVDSHRGLPIVDLPRSRLDSVELLPFKRAIDAGIGSVMVGHIALPQIDGEEVKPLKEFITVETEAGSEQVVQKATIPASLSHKMQTDLLRNELGFKGLIVSDAMGMSGLTIYFTQEEAGVRAVLAGTDILEKPADVEAMIRGLKAAVASRRVPMARLDDAVIRQIAWKHELDLFKNKMTPLDPIDRIVSGNETVALSDEIGTKAITLVRSEAGMLPLDRNAKIAVLGISNGFDGSATMASFVGGLRNGGLKFTPAYLQENSMQPQIDAARKAVNEADVIVVGLYGRVRTGAKNSVGIPENGAGILKEALAANKKVIGISFGNPYILSSFSDLKTYIVAYGDMPSLQRAAARSVLGQQQFYGKLPISLPGLYPCGTGLKIEYPKPISLPKPSFPPAARAIRAFGDVPVDVRIDESGRVTSAVAISGHPLLRRSSEAAALSARFEVISENGPRNLVLVYRYMEESSTPAACCDNFPYIISVFGSSLVIDTTRQTV